jgi:hypothetical protein
MARRVHTENVFDDKGNMHDDMPYDLNELSDHDEAYDEEEDYVQEGNKNGGAPAEGADDGTGDLINYKGIYFNDDPG